jgi:hypothetical protein
MGLGFLMEASTPFVSLRAVLSRLDMKSSFAYVCNGIAMVAVFFCCRDDALANLTTSQRPI